MSGQNAPFFVDNEVIVLNRNGQWIADGTEITHDGTRELFAKNLHREPDGTYWLKVGRERKQIEVEDTALFVSSVEGSPSAGYRVRLPDLTWVPLVPESLSYRPGRLVCRVDHPRLGAGAEAKFLHAAYFDLLKELQEDAAGYFLLIQGKRVGLAGR